MVDAKTMIEALEYLLHDTSASMWTTAKKLWALNRSYSQVVNRIMTVHENWFYEEATLTPGTKDWDRTQYVLPTCPAMMKILYLTNTDGRPISPINLQSREYSAVAVPERVYNTGWWLSDTVIHVNSSDLGDNLRLYYLKKPADFITGTAGAGDGTTMTMAADPAPDIRDDYYNKTWFRLTGGTGAGERAQCTDSAGGTRILTIDFTTAPDATSVYASESKLPEGHNEVVVYGAAIRAIQMDVAQLPKLNEFKSWYTKLEYDLIDFLNKRQSQKARSVHMTNME